MATDSAAGASARDKVLQGIERALGANRIDEAVSLAHQAEFAGAATPLVLNLVAFGLENQGRFAEALQRLDKALELEPGNVLTLSAIGQCLSKQGRSKDALQAFDAALAIYPSHAPAHHGRGAALAALGEDEAAWDSESTAVALDPRYPDAVGGLAELAFKRGDFDTAREKARQGLSLDPRQSASTQVLALLAAREGDATEATRLLEALLGAGGLTPLHEATTRRLLADQLEKLNRYPEAFESYDRANRAMWQVYGQGFDITGVETAAPLCRRLYDYFSKADPQAWGPVAESQPAPASGHVFLVGFVRSGTTLLEQILASHPDVVALEEKPTLRALTAEYFSDNQGLDRLAALTEAEADALRKVYWESVSSFGVDVAGKTFVDKAPLSSIWQPLISRLFPNAKILFAVRDPRDVVLSCFRHAFLVNAMTGAFSNLEKTAELYSEVMRLSALYADVLPLPVYRHRHEDLIDDLEGQSKALCAFMGLDWDASMLDFVATAERRDIRTPSAGQVRQGLNKSGVAQWKRYEDKITPIVPILQPWISSFGYESE